MADQSVMYAKELIEYGPEYHRLYAPNLELYQARESDLGRATLALVSSRKEYWTVFSCLVAYANGTNSTPRNILEAVPFREIISDRWGEEAIAQVDFLSYCSQIGELSLGQVVGVAYTVNLAVQSDGLDEATDILTRFGHHVCKDKYWDHDPRCYARCIRGYPCP